MPNGGGSGAEWAAIDQLRREQSDTRRDVAVVENETRGIKAGQDAIVDALDDFKKELTDRIDEVEERMDGRFDKQRTVIIAGLGFAVTVITALGTALLNAGGG